MYFWKCWRATPASFLFTVVLGIAGSALSAWAELTHGLSAKQIPALGAALERTAANWHTAASQTGVLLGFLAVIAGVALGVNSMGEEVASGSALFLFTRPRSRRYFDRVAWGMASLEMAAFSLLSVLALFFTLVWFTGTIRTWLPFWLVPVVFVSGMLCYGVAGIITVATRNSSQGASLAIFVCFGYMVVWQLLRQSRIFLPSPAWLYDRPWIWTMTTIQSPPVVHAGGGVSTGSTGYGYIVASHAPLPVWSLLGWLLVAVALAIVQETLTDRAEV